MKSGRSSSDTPALKARPQKKKRPVQHPHKKRMTATKKKRKRQKRSKKTRRKTKKTLYHRLIRFGKEFIISLLLMLALVYLISCFTFSFAKVQGYSMLPTFDYGDRVFVNKLGKLRRFKLVAYHDKKTDQVKVQRIVGLPNEVVDYKNDQLLINDRAVVERFIVKAIEKAKNNESLYTEDISFRETTKEWTVPKDKYVLLGDNRPYAAENDSRTLGYIDKKQIIGVVEMRVWPLHKLERF